MSRWRQVSHLADLLSYAAGRTVQRELGSNCRWETQFTDGTAVLVDFDSHQRGLFAWDGGGAPEGNR